MAGKAVDGAKNLINTIGAMQTLVENFPMSLMSLFSFRDVKLQFSFDLIVLLFKILGITREEAIELVTNFFSGGMKNDEDGSSVVAYVEEIVKMALEAKLINMLNCSTNPIISNDLLNEYAVINGVTKSGEGILLDVSEIDFTGVLNRSPFTEEGSKFYFDLEDENGEKYNVQNLYKSKDFNAFLWYIINKSDVSQRSGERIWDNRYKAKIYGNKTPQHKEIIQCTYIDEDYPNSDKIRVQLCASNYYKTRKLSKKAGSQWTLNKTIFEFNHEFLSSIKLYDPKVMIAEVVQYLMGDGNLNVNIGLSINEQIIEGKLQQIIRNVIEADDTEINDCYFSFSNDEYNNMLEQAELIRYNKIRANGQIYESNSSNILNNLSGITSSSKPINDKTIIKNTLEELTVTPAQDASGEISYNIGHDWAFELIRALAYPFIRPLFTPKVIFLLMVNKKIMGSLEDDLLTMEKIINSLFIIIKNVIIKLKDMLIEILLNYIIEKLAPLIALFASRLLLESLIAYKDLLLQCVKACLILPRFNFGSNKLIGVIDDVNYADIIPSQETPGQSSC